MKSNSKIVRIITKPRLLFVPILRRLAKYISNDELYVKWMYYFYTGKRLNLQNPKTYNEKLQWQKVYDHNPQYTIMADKFAAKEYVANIIGEDYIIPTIGVWDNADAIEWEALPQQFVLKTTHDSGGVIVVKDKSKLDKQKAKQKLNSCLRKDNFATTREWPYKNIKRRIIAEKYMEDVETGELRDYKFFCFDGDVKALFISQDRGKEGEEVKFTYFDADFNPLDIFQYHSQPQAIPSKPYCFEQMKEFASKLSRGIPQVRVDFYEVNRHVFFGELTFFHHGGIVPFTPEKWDRIFGSWIKLPKATK